MTDLYEPRIVCAANQHKDGAIVIGIRHFDGIMHDTINLRKESNLYESWDGCDQGFVDQHGNFWDRREAWVIAAKNGQIIRRVGGDSLNGGTLFSENLY